MAYTTINKHTDYFNTLLYSGTGSARTVSGVGFQPDFFWIKQRSSTQGHLLWDATRGGNYYLPSNGAGGSAADIGTFTAASDGYSLATDGAYNGNSQTYVGWNWKANGQGSANNDGSINTTYTSVNTTAGFSIVKYTGNGTSGATVGHGLGVVPKMIIVKALSGSNNWAIYHASMGATKYLRLNATDAEATSTARWNDTAPTSSVFSVGNDGEVNSNTVSYVAYCFADKTGYSKFGKYTGNGSTDGTFVYTGFKPSFVIYKGFSGANTADNWEMVDNKRSPHNGVENVLYPNLQNAEGTGVTTRMDLLSNGFKMRTSGSDYNNNGATYIYMAFGQALVGSNNVCATAR